MTEVLSTERRRFPWWLLVVVAIVVLGAIRVVTNDDNDNPKPTAHRNSLFGEENARADGSLYVTEGWPMRLSRLDLRTGESSTIPGLPVALEQLQGLISTERGLYIKLASASYVVPRDSQRAQTYDAPGTPLRATADGKDLWYAVNDPQTASQLRIINNAYPYDPPITLPPHSFFGGDTPRGLLVGQESYVQLWDPIRRRTIREFPNTKAFAGQVVITAAGSGCWKECRLTATDLRTSTSTRLHLKVGNDDELRLSDDGNWLAVQYVDRQRPNTISGYRVEHLTTGRVHRVPGYTPTRTGAFSMGWTRDERLVIAEAYTAESLAQSTIALWTPGAEQLKIVERANREGMVRIVGEA